jgi:hypothetical protein
MSLSHRAWAQEQCGDSLVAISLLIAVLAAPLASAFAGSDENAQQRFSLPSAPTEAFAGQISYDFDSVLNKTTASYTASLGKRGLLHRIFFPSPAVHTITASYVFVGRIASRVPDTIRVRLESDEYLVDTVGGEFALGYGRVMTLDVGERAVQHSLSVSQRIEIDSTPRQAPNRLGASARAQDSFRLLQVRQTHIKRRATAWFSTCEFLSLINQREIRGTVAGLDFTVNPEVVTGLNLFAAKMLPDSAMERSVDCSPK